MATDLRIFRTAGSNRLRIRAASISLYNCDKGLDEVHPGGDAAVGSPPRLPQSPARQKIQAWKRRSFMHGAVSRGAPLCRRALTGRGD